MRNSLTGAPRPVYRNRQAAIVQASAGVIGFLATALPALTASVGDPATLVVFKIVFLVVAFIVLFFGLRGAASCVQVLDDGVRIVNPLSSRNPKWSEIREFRLGRWGRLPSVCLVELLDGETLHAWGLSARNPTIHRDDPRAETAIAALNDLLKDRRS
jgi:hypothetical protein